MSRSTRPDSKSKVAAVFKKSSGVAGLAAQSAEFGIFSKILFQGELYKELFPAVGIGAGVAPALHITSQVIELCNGTSEEKMRDVILGAVHSLGTATLMNVAVWDEESLVSAPVLFSLALSASALRTAFNVGYRLNSIDKMQEQLLDPDLQAAIAEELNKKSKAELTAIILESCDMVRQFTAVVALIRTGAVGELLKMASTGKPIPIDIQVYVGLFLLLSTPGLVMNAKNVLMNAKDLASMLCSGLYSGLSACASTFTNCLAKCRSGNREKDYDEEAALPDAHSLNSGDGSISTSKYSIMQGSGTASAETKLTTRPGEIKKPASPK